MALSSSVSMMVQCGLLTWLRPNNKVSVLRVTGLKIFQ